jgi:hypothetical protein
VIFLDAALGRGIREHKCNSFPSQLNFRSRLRSVVTGLVFRYIVVPTHIMTMISYTIFLEYLTPDAAFRYTSVRSIEQIAFALQTVLTKFA